MDQFGSEYIEDSESYSFEFGCEVPDELVDLPGEDSIREYTSNCPECDSSIYLEDQGDGMLNFDCKACGTSGSIQLEDDTDDE